MSFESIGTLHRIQYHFSTYATYDYPNFLCRHHALCTYHIQPAHLSSAQAVSITPLRPLPDPLFIKDLSLRFLSSITLNNTSRNPPSRMPPRQHPHRNHHRRKLQPTKKPLMTAQIPKNTLTRLRQPKNRPQINQQTRHRQRRKEWIFRPNHPSLHVPSTSERPPKSGQEHEEDGECKGLEGEAGEEDVVGYGGAYVL